MLLPDYWIGFRRSGEPLSFRELDARVLPATREAVAYAGTRFDDPKLERIPAVRQLLAFKSDVITPLQATPEGKRTLALHNLRLEVDQNRPRNYTIAGVRTMKSSQALIEVQSHGPDSADIIRASVTAAE